MKQVFFSLIIVLTLAISCQAQTQTGQKTPAERAAFQTEWMKENLGLNDEQEPVIDALNLEYANKMETVKQINGKLAQLKAAKSISEEKDSKLKNILSQAQFQAYLDKKQELRTKAMEMYKERNQ